MTRKTSQSSNKRAFERKSPKSHPKMQTGKTQKSQANGDLIRLNKFIAHAGICSRREADKLIESGVISVNGIIVKNLGTKISPEDEVKFDDRILRSEKKYYVLLNKPKGYITTTEDPFDRKTVMGLIKEACKERIYPVGRLDKETSGLLMFTNDGALAKKLTHPRHMVRKIYHVVLNKALTKSDMVKILDGVSLDDGIVKADKVAYVSEASNKKEVGIELHSGKNRIIRRIFESLDYRIIKLDRVSFASLTKKDIPRGKWRYLTEKEINYLKML